MLKITKKGDKYWLFEDSEMSLFSPSKFTINLLNNAITIVYENGLKSKNYNVIDCEIYDLGATSPFTTSSGDLFMQKLEELNCPCFQKNENIFNISGVAWGDITGNLYNQTDLQTALDSKLDKSTTPSSVYGNDEMGEPTMIPVSDLGTDSIAYFFQGGVTMPSINTWYANNIGFAINGTNTFGTGALPSGAFGTIGSLVIPSGYILEKIIFGEYFNPGSLTHDLEIAVLRGEFNVDQLSNSLFNYEILVQQTLSIGYLSTSPKYFKELTIASHSAKERSALQVYMRQKTNNSQSGYSMTFIFKKA